MTFQLNVKATQFQGKPMPGVLHVKAQRVDLTATRGIIFDKPERWAVNTPVGQIDIGVGDWVLEVYPHCLYVMKDGDFKLACQAKQRKWWHLW